MHVYMQNKGGHRVKVVKTDPMGRGEVHDRYLLLEPIVSEMKQVASAANAEDVTPNWNACEKFGGCPYQSICPSVGRSVLTGMDEETMPESNEKRIPLSERMKAKAIVETVTKPGDVIPAATQALATGINPPDAAKPAPVTPWNPDAPVGPTHEATNQLDVPRSMTLAQAAENEALHLFVDCAPVRGDSLVKHLDAIIVQRTPEILAHCRKADPKCVPDGAVDVREVKFGQGVAALVASFAKHPPAGNVVAHSGALTNQILDVLQPVAARVIRAL